MATSTGRGKATTKQQRCAVLDWLEIPANFKFITRGVPPGPPVVGGRKLKKSDAYKQLAQHVNDELGYSSSAQMWDKRVAKIRYESLLKTYRKTREKYQESKNHPESGQSLLTEEEMSQGKTIEMKLNELCPFYERWDGLYDALISSKGMENDEHGAHTGDYDAAAEFSNDDEPFAEREDVEHVRLSLATVDDDRDDEYGAFAAPDAGPAGGPAVTASAHREGPDSVSIRMNPNNGGPTLAAKSPNERRRPDASMAPVAVRAKRRESEAVQNEKNRDLEVASRRLELDRKVAQDELEFKRQVFHEESQWKRQCVRDNFKKDVTVALVQQGKTAAEVKEYLAELGCE